MLKSIFRNQNSESRSRTSHKGFTMIELLIVIAIIAALATMFISTYPASQKRTRDTVRKSDLKQYQTALELYANKQANGGYPIQTSAIDPSTSTFCNTTLGLANCSVDPKNATNVCSSGNCRYNYVTNANGLSYAVWARLENPTTTSSPYYIICSSGVAKESATAPAAGNTCP